MHLLRPRVALAPTLTGSTNVCQSELADNGASLFCDDFTSVTATSPGPQWSGSLNGGGIASDGSVADFTSPTGDGDFPYFYPSGSAIPATGGFTVTVRMQYGPEAPYGTNFELASAQPPNDSSEGTVDALDVAGVHQDINGPFMNADATDGSSPQGCSINLTDAQNFHTYSWDYRADSTVTLSIDGVVEASCTNALRPAVLWLGQAVQVVGDAPWNPISFDYVIVNPDVDETRSYVALGDSFSSGNGAPSADYYPGTSFKDSTTGGTTGCHRSDTAYPLGVASALGLSASQWTSVACSGAVTSDIGSENYDYEKYGEVEAPQIDSVDPSSTQIATITMGGNDVGFQDILSDCSFDQTGLSPGRPGCRDAGRVAYTDATLGLQNLPSQLVPIYEAIASRLMTGGTLIVSGYPSFFGRSKKYYTEVPYANTDPNIFGCAVGAVAKKGPIGADPIGISYQDAQWIDSIEDQGDQIIDNAVSTADSFAETFGVHVVYAPADPAFHGHRLCDSGSSYLNGALFKGVKTSPIDQSFHPNIAGQQAYSEAFIAQLP